MVQPAGFQTAMVGGYDGAALQAFAVSTTGEVMVGGDGAPGNSGLNTPALVKDRAGVSRPWAAAGFVFNSASYDAVRTPLVWKDVSAVAVVAGTGFTAWTPGAGKKFRLMGYALSSSAAASIIFGDNAVGTVLHRTPLLTAGGVFVSPPMGNGQLSAAANNVLKIDVSVASTLTGFLFGTEE